MLSEEELLLICVCGLEWEGGLEDRLGLGVPSCAVTEIWGSERPVGEKENQSKTERDEYQVYKKTQFKIIWFENIFVFNLKSSHLSE